MWPDVRTMNRFPLYTYIRIEQCFRGDVYKYTRICVWVSVHFLKEAGPGHRFYKDMYALIK